MPAKKAKRKKALLMARLGPPVNLRPAGAHHDRRRLPRSAQRVETAKDIVVDYDQHVD